MKGSYQITVANEVVKYEFTIRRNITIIKGDSATGKTTLVEMIREYYEDGESSGVHLQCPKECRVISGRDWKVLLQNTRESIIFIDENNEFLPTPEFADAVKESDNYFVLVTREGLPNLPYSADEIYGIRVSGKYAGLKQTYNEFYHIYGEHDFSRDTEPELLLVEDSNSGFEFFQHRAEEKGYKAVSAGGKSNIFRTLQEVEGKSVLVIADGAAFGPEMDRVMKMNARNPQITVYLPESFEWLLLASGVVSGKEVQDILRNPPVYIDSREFFSWERFFTHLLTDLTHGTWLQYSKRKLNPAYLQKGVCERIIAVMEKIKV